MDIDGIRVGFEVKSPDTEIGENEPGNRHNNAMDFLDIDT